MGCIKTSAIKSKLTSFCLKLIYEILVPSNPLNYGKSIVGNTNMEEIKKDGLAGKKGSSGNKCCLSKIEKQAVAAKVALLQSTSIWICDSGASVHCMDDKMGGINIHEGGIIGTMGDHDEAMTASSIMDVAGTWCN